jgi:hypothetical protein
MLRAFVRVFFRQRGVAREQPPGGISSRSRLFVLCMVALILVFTGRDALADPLCEWYANGAMTFAIDPSTTPGPILATVTAQPAVKCDIGFPFSLQAVSTNAGGVMSPCPITGALLGENGRVIPYIITCVAGGSGLGILPAEPPVVLGVGGSVSVADYQDAVAGSVYSDRITFQITF